MESVNVAELMESIRSEIEDKKRKGLYTDAELRDIAEHPLNPVLDAHEFKSTLLEEFRAPDAGWNFRFGPDTLFRSSRGLAGRALEALRALLGPVQKLFWNPNPMIAALSRQSDLNSAYVHVLHNLAQELTRLSLEVQDLKNRNLQLLSRLELAERREKTLESMVVYRGGEPRDPGGDEGR